MRRQKQYKYSQFKERDKFGIRDNLTNKIIIPPIYDFASPEIYDDKLILVTKDGKDGFVDLNNQVIIPITYESAREFKDGFAPVCINGSWGYINRKNEIKIKPNPDWKWVTLFDNNVAIVRVNDHDYYYIDREGNYMNIEPFSAAEFFEDGYAIAAKGNKPLPFNNELQIIDLDFKFMSNEKFNQIEFLGKKKFKVVKVIDNKGRIRTGSLKIGENVKWNKETDQLNIWIDKIEYLQSQFKFYLNEEECFCQFPRIVDYVTYRAHYDSDILRNIVIDKLKFIETKDLGNYEEDTIYRCSKCNSEYLLLIRTNPRGEPHVAGFRQIKDNCENKIGAKVMKEVPVSIIHYGPLGLYDGNLHLRKCMYYDKLDNLIKYLFKKYIDKNRKEG